MSDSGAERRRAALPQTVFVISLCVLALAAVIFVLTVPQKTKAPVAAPTPSASPTPSAAPSPSAPPLDRSTVYVVVFNNTNVTGLARTIAGKASTVGWKVVGSGNWYGTIDENTVYYPPDLADAAGILASDLGIKRTKPAIAPMQMDRLTVIITDAQALPQ